MGAWVNPGPVLLAAEPWLQLQNWGFWAGIPEMDDGKEEEGPVRGGVTEEPLEIG